MSVFTMLEKRSPGPGDDFWYRPVPTPISSGIEIDEEIALTASAVWSAITIIAGGLGSLPLKLLHRTGPRSKEVARDHPAHRVVHRRPNDWQTAFEYREMTQGHVLTRGNGYSQIIRDQANRLTDLVPLHPGRIRPKVENGALVYEFTQPDGRIRTFPAAEILHIRGLSPNGIVGYSPITLARESIGLTLAAERHGATLFGNDARPGGVLETPDKLDEQQRENLAKTWSAAHSGGNAHSVAVLEQNLQWKAVGFSSDDAQFLQTRQFQIAEIARWFNVPPHKLKDLLRATFTNIEQQNIEFVVDTMRPWAERWEQRYDVSLLTEQEQADGFFFKFSLDALLRGDSAARAAFFTAMFQMGVLSTNDIREAEDLDEVDGGDQRFVPMNMNLLEDAGLDILSGDVPPAQLEPGDEGRALTAGVDWEQREQRSLKLRRRYQLRFEKVFRDAGARVVARETKALRRIIKSELGERGIPELNDKITAFYEELSEYIARQMLPIVETYADLVQAAAMEEIGNEPDMTDELRQFTKDYVDAMTLRHIGRSKGQLEAIVLNTPPEELEGALNQRLDEWDETRADKIGTHESVQSGAAIALTAWAGAGVSFLVWRTVGVNCPLCNRMNGKRVSTSRNFLEKGDVVQPLFAEDDQPLEGDPQRTNPLKIRKAISHPPLHGKCDCTLVAGR